MGKIGSALVWAIVGAVVLGVGAFGYLMLTAPKGDPSVFGASMIGALAAGVVGLIGGGLYGGLKRSRA